MMMMILLPDVSALFLTKRGPPKPETLNSRKENQHPHSCKGDTFLDKRYARVILLLLLLAERRGFGGGADERDEEDYFF